MIHFVKPNDINTIYYISNEFDDHQTQEYLGKLGWVWLEDGIHYFRKSSVYPCLIFADNTKKMMMSRIHEQYLKQSWYITLIRSRKIKKLLKDDFNI